MTVTIVCLTIICGIVILLLGITIYNQMLLVNQINKRLLLMAKESIEKERMTMEEYQATLDSFEAEGSTQITSIVEPAENSAMFDPHTYTEDHEL